jgi:glyoxylase-like metal-dependent hydrolase (beta-lactamase superfamily II)
MEIVDGIHAIDYDFVSAYLVEDRDHLTLIDTGVADAAVKVLDEIARIGRKPSDLQQIVLTHAHFDHTGSVADLVELTGAAVLVHRLDAPVARGDAAICPPILSDLERPYAEQASSRVLPAAPCAVDRELDDGDVIEISEGATVVHVPGHTPGSIALYLWRQRALICGDAVASLNGRPIVGFFNCDPEQAARSFARLAEMDFDVACFGHGDPLLGDGARAFRRLAERLGLRGEA